MFLTTTDAARRLGVSQRRVQALIGAGRLPAERYGRDWLIRVDALAAVRDRKPGRPPGRRDRTASPTRWTGPNKMPPRR